MTATGFHLFDTAIGCCGIAWNDRGIAAVRLPDAQAQTTRASLQRRFPEAREGAPPPDVAQTVKDIIALIGGEARDLAGAVLDVERVPSLNRRVYEIARTIVPGATLTYGEIATRLGDASLARDVGQALGQNPFPIIVPCHRVLAAGGKIGGFSAPGSIMTKRKLLAIEAVHAITAPRLFP
jgi:methylated-DNA-[protein]-cysteine S-methyltransferase